ncbi:MAG: HAD-IC family P-type ATPase, partial [Patescibacteria group bacterium]
MDFSDLHSYLAALWADLHTLVVAVRSTPRSTPAINLGLVTLSLALAAAGIVGGWIAARPRERQVVGAAIRRVFSIFGAARKPGLQQAVPASWAQPLHEVLPPMQPDPHTGPDGLTDQQVRQQVTAGQVNRTQQHTSRSYAHILVSNIFTRFNAILGSLLVVILLIVRQPQDALFGFILLLNTSIGIIQEVRAKWALDRLAIYITHRARVVRNGVAAEIPSSSIVAGDLIELSAGNQVPVDGIVLRSEGLEVNESLISGESEPVVKSLGAEVYSGSFIAAGTCRIQAVRIGEQSYARRLANAARQFTLSRSELRRAINRILKYVAWFLAPTSLLLFATQLLYSQHGWRDAVTGSIAGVVEMIPDGLVLLTSVVMALAIIRLARQRALIQELPAVELLARVDVLCLDKTGTLTEYHMRVEQAISIERTGQLPAEPSLVLGAFAQAQHRTATLAAIGDAYQPPAGPGWGVQSNVPFSPVRQWSALTFSAYGTWVLGAPETVLAGRGAALASVQPIANEHAAAGKRVLVLAYAGRAALSAAGSEPVLPPETEPTLALVIGEQLRQNVSQTLRYFADQGVAVKIISGDNPKTVAAIARAAGLTVGQPVSGNQLPTTADELAE